jgi:hypothetical protein
MERMLIVSCIFWRNEEILLETTNSTYFHAIPELQYWPDVHERFANTS